MSLCSCKIAFEQRDSYLPRFNESNLVLVLTGTSLASGQLVHRHANGVKYLCLIVLSFESVFYELSRVEI